MFIAGCYSGVPTVETSGCSVHRMGPLLTVCWFISVGSGCNEAGGGNWDRSIVTSFSASTL